MSSTTWVGGHGNHWSTARDWSGDQVPQAGDDVTIGAGYVVDVDIAAAAADISLGVGAVLDVTATLDVSGTLSGGTVDLKGGVVNLANTATLDGVKWVGMLALADGGTLNVEGGLSVVAPGGGDGTIDLQQQSSDTELYVDDSETWNYSTVEGNGIVYAEGTAAGDTLTLGKHETVNIPAGTGDIEFSCYNGITSTTVDTAGLIIDDHTLGYSFGYSTNSGTVEIGPNATDNLFEETFTNTGLIEAVGGGTGLFTTFYYGAFDGSDVTNYTPATETLAGGTWEAGSGSTLDLQLNGGITSDSATTVLDGPAATIAVWNSTDSSYQSLADTVTTLGGMLQLLDGANWITGNQLTVTGKVEMGGGTLSAAGGLDLNDGRVIGTGTIGQAGGAAVVLDGGKIEAQGGLLDVASQVSGTGALRIDVGATLELAGAAESVAYLGVATLSLDNPAMFTGGLQGVAAGDILVLGNVAADSVKLSGGKLTIDVAGGGFEQFRVAGTATGASFVESGGNAVVTFTSGALLDAVGPTSGFGDSLAGAGHPFG